MARVPTGTVECRDPQVCRGARFHYPHTVAACGATKTTVASAAATSASPPRQQADPSCPVHGLDDMDGEYEMAALNRRQLAAGVLSGAAILGVCSCSPNTDVTPSPDSTIEQTVQPSPSLSPSELPDDYSPRYTDTDWPSMQDGYEYSDEPQGPAEQWIFDNHPDLWERGVRAVTERGNVIHPDDMTLEPQPSELVRYINGKRYEGTENMPLGFSPGNVESVDEFRTDVLDNVKSEWSDFSLLPIEVGNTGEDGYSIYIDEDPFAGPTRGTFVHVNRYGIRDGSGYSNDEDQLRFPSWEEAWQWVQDNNFTPPDAERQLYKGEIASIVVKESLRGDYDSIEGSNTMVYDPNTGEFDTVYESRSN